MAVNNRSDAERPRPSSPPPGPPLEARADVSDVDEASPLVDEVLSRAARIDVVIANADVLRGGRVKVD